MKYAKMLGQYLARRGSLTNSYFYTHTYTVVPGRRAGNVTFDLAEHLVPIHGSFPFLSINSECYNWSFKYSC